MINAVNDELVNLCSVETDAYIAELRNQLLLLEDVLQEVNEIDDDPNLMSGYCTSIRAKTKVPHLNVS